ncbi:MAG: ABC transporter permease subunit [Oxalobacteraceae bacterium]|jgi:general L-amino acid transport system permease protein|uniref:amino acid ABC transporter permease n=1 Tax=Rhizobium sp. Leaf306 TaxID=1736330 RepID=UPI000714892F|nr:ABC transporter permease subunit [Rhizobium sp. Leaf306]KQQ32889.1 amino acid ABC transporter permease [Rhizobium sp. Leaf306]RYE64204.1 MAG: ABC transporter permease subunit [Oxalobacteraceae bacterium]
MISAVLDNRRFRSWGGQILLLGGFAALLLWLVNNTVTNLDARGIKVGFDFLWRRANFPISESVLPYDPSDSFLWAYVTGVGNTLAISVLAIFLSTALGLLVGLARRSKHPLTSGVAGVFVTTMRNMPLIVHLLFWYALATTALPAPREAYNPLPGVFLSLRGFYIPALELDAMAWLMIGLVILVTLGAWRLRHLMMGTGRWHDCHPVLALFGLTAVVALGAALLLQPSAVISFPEMRGFNFTGGLRLSPEFAALMLGLVIYTSAFIGEIIRGGIDAVSIGQWEAGRAIGLSERHTLTKIIIPQALRIIIPPMTSQYLSTVKNTTLALAVGYPELGLVVGTVINQTGQAIESIGLLLGIFLTISIAVSLFMNWYNAHVALVEVR